ncbi:hypothetical protein FJTKL_15501 [Diaporthe vaccinii]|uniref:Uncharacterized protein n=1 Tax=Diaporthe vaccinii TaxID=105482 RepID=A0ABR4F6Q0_9PEZI
MAKVGLLSYRGARVFQATLEDVDKQVVLCGPWCIGPKQTRQLIVSEQLSPQRHLKKLSPSTAHRTSPRQILRATSFPRFLEKHSSRAPPGCRCHRSSRCHVHCRVPSRRHVRRRGTSLHGCNHCHGCSHHRVRRSHPHGHRHVRRSRHLHHG